MKFEKHLKDISWSELESWIGSGVFQRGESYFKSGDLVPRVVEIRGLSDGFIC